MTSPTIPVLKVADFASRPVTARKWIVEPIIPEGEPTLFYGPGAAGKSLLLLQLALALTAGRPWLGKHVPTCRVLFFTCEDDADEINRRAVRVLEGLGATWEDCGDRLAVVPMRECDASSVLASAERDGTLKATPTYESLHRKILIYAPDVVIVDTLADAFAGNENDRAHAKQFIRMVQALGGTKRVTFIVTAHPSVSGMETGRGASGSTGWPNAVRSHLYLERAKGDGDMSPDPDARVLSNMKGNYGQAGAGAITMRWSAGLFVPVDLDAHAGDQAALAESVFLDCLAAYTAQGRRVNAAGGATYAPNAFAVEPRAKAAGVTKRALKAAMTRLFEAERIRVEHERRGGHTRSYLVIVPS